MMVKGAEGEVQGAYRWLPHLQTASLSKLLHRSLPWYPCL